jgi:hypothetical protein
MSTPKDRLEYQDWLNNQVRNAYFSISWAMCTGCDESPEALDLLNHMMRFRHDATNLIHQCLRAATQLNKLKIVKFLLNQHDGYANDLCCTAMHYDNVACFQIFLDYVKDHRFPIHLTEWLKLACRYSSFKILFFLLEHPLLKIQHLQLALDYTCEQFPNLPLVVMFLIHHGVDNIDANPRDKGLIAELLDLGLDPRVFSNQKRVVAQVMQYQRQQIEQMKSILSFLPHDVIEHCVGPYINYTQCTHTHTHPQHTQHTSITHTQTQHIQTQHTQHNGLGQGQETNLMFN